MLNIWSVPMSREHLHIQIWYRTKFYWTMVLAHEQVRFGPDQSLDQIFGTERFRLHNQIWSDQIVDDWNKTVIVQNYKKFSTKSKWNISGGSSDRIQSRCHNREVISVFCNGFFSSQCSEEYHQVCTFKCQSENQASWIKATLCEPYHAKMYLRVFSTRYD